MPANEEYLRSPKLMHRVFCGSALLLLVTTVWMMWADYNDEWRGYQRNAFKYQAGRLQARQASMKSAADHVARVTELESRREQAKRELAALDKALKDGKLTLKDFDSEQEPEQFHGLRERLKPVFDRLGKDELTVE